jgi:1-acyl-sn-glycerol-3-phosphate acyltransferase
MTAIGRTLDRPEVRRAIALGTAVLIFIWKKVLPVLGRFITLYILSPFYRVGTYVIARVVWHPRVVGFERMPDKGPLLLISNHVSYVDGFLLYAFSKRPIRFVIDAEIYMTPGVHYFMKLTRAIPIAANREGVTKALTEVSDALKNSEVVGIFPEGLLTRTGSLGRFKPGTEWILKRNPVPVLPIAITGLWGSVFSRKYWKRRFPWWPRHLNLKITMICGNPIPPEEATVNRLQREVLKLKYLASEQEE